MAGKHLLVKVISAVVCALTAAAAAQQIDKLNLPARPAGAMTGSQFKDYILNMARSDREVAIYNEIKSGNVPDFNRNLKPVSISATISGTPHTVTFYVTPEVTSVGSDADYFRLPMSADLAQWVADLTSCSLPTKKMAGAIWSAASCKLSPQPIAPSPNMITVPVFWDHEQMVRSSRSANGAPLGALVTGHKKDVVLSPRIYQYPSPARVLIFGWYYTDGTFIQPLSGVHESTYADYSHGIRLINQSVLLDGTTTTLSSILYNSTLETILNDDTGVDGSGNSTGVHVAYNASTMPARYPAGSPPAGFPYLDRFPQTGRELSGWTNRFQIPNISSFSPTSPGGDGYVLIVKDPSGGIDTTRIGSASDSNYAVQCDIYCNYRPALSGDGFERVGIFIRDDGNGMFCGTNGAGTIKGNNYCLTWDSNNGRLQCLKTINGIPTDLAASPVFQATSAWRRMRIEALGSNLTFKVDGSIIASVTDTARSAGQFGIGYQEQFITNANILGTYADNFSATTLTSAIGDWKLY